MAGPRGVAYSSAVKHSIREGMREIARRFKVDFTLAPAREHAQSYAQLEAGRAEAFATTTCCCTG